VELLLNLCWLVISAGALGAWHANCRRRKRADDFERVCAEGVALVCALILLFFPISITDDLHPEIFLTADCLSHRRNPAMVCAGKTAGHLPAPCGTSPFATLRAGRTVWPSLLFAGPSEERVSTLRPASTGMKRGRAPPLA